MRRLLALGLGCFCLLAGSAEAATTRTVTIRGNVYSPPYLRVEPGDTVVFRNLDREVHTATSLPGAPGFFGTGALRPGQQYAQLFLRPGRYGYLNAARPRDDQRGVIQVGPDRTKPRVGGLAVRASSSKVVVGATLSEDVRFSITVRRGSKRVLALRPTRVGQGRFTYSFSLRGTTALRPGRYKATIETRDVVGNRGRTATVAFRVK